MQARRGAFMPHPVPESFIVLIFLVLNSVRLKLSFPKAGRSAEK